MTKKLLILAVGLFLATTTVQAQQFNDSPKNELSVSYGLAPATDVINAFTDILGTIFSAGYYTDEWKSTGAINIDYTHKATQWLNVGAYFGYSNMSCDIYFNKKINGHAEKSFYTVMPTAKFNWFRREHISMYSRVSVGVMFTDKEEKQNDNGKVESGSDVDWMAQISPFGIEVGGNHIRGFYEVGFGQAGMGQIGVRARF